MGDTTAKQRDMVALDFDIALTAIGEQKQELIAKGEATPLFGQYSET